MFQHIAWERPQQWHLDLSSDKMTVLERGIAIGFFTALTALCAQFILYLPISPVPFTLQTFAVTISTSPNRICRGGRVPVVIINSQRYVLFLLSVVKYHQISIC